MRIHPLAYKCRIYPSKKQEEQLTQTLQICQELYNKLLAKYKEDCQNKKYIPTLKDYFQNLALEYKQDSKSLQKLEESSIKDVINNLSKAIRQKANPQQVQFKDERKRVNSFLLIDKPDIQLNDKDITLEKYGKIKLRYGKSFSDKKILSYRIKKQCHIWFLIVTVKINSIQPFKKTGKKVGIDLGISHLIILSNGKKYDPPNISEIELKIKNLKEKLSTKTYGSRAYNATRDKLDKQKMHRQNIIIDYYHKLSTELVREYDFIAMESLNIQVMARDPRYKNQIYKANWQKFITMIKYKCELYGKTFVQVEAKYPSSKICNSCGYKFNNLTIDVREWKCPNCTQINDRDVNAARNILKHALNTQEKRITI